MDVVEGFLGLIIIFHVFLFTAGVVVLFLLFVFLKTVNNLWIRFGVISLPAILGFIYAYRADASMLLVFGMMPAGVPMAVLLTPFVLSKSDQNILHFRQVFLCDVIVSCVAAFIPFFIVFSGISMVPFIYRHTQFSNFIVYICALALYILLAACIYRIFHSLENFKILSPPKKLW
jgi:hypothetical protein